MDGTNDGHYDRRIIETPGAAKGLRLELESVIKNKERVNGLKAQARMLRVRDDRIGFIIESRVEGIDASELWMGGYCKRIPKQRTWIAHDQRVT